MVSKLLQKMDSVAEVVWDQKRDRIDTGIRALLAHSPSATHHMVVQDDAVIPHDLASGVSRILQDRSFRKDIPLCLYAGNVGIFAGKFERAFKVRDYSWMTMKGLNWGVAVVIPALDIEPLVSFMQTRREPQYDLRISRYFEQKKTPVWYPVPSLVDHDDGPSLIEGHGSNRKAWRFVGENNSALNFDIHKGVIHLPLTRKFVG